MGLATGFDFDTGLTLEVIFDFRSDFGVAGQEEFDVLTDGLMIRVRSSDSGICLRAGSIFR